MSTRLDPLTYPETIEQGGRTLIVRAAFLQADGSVLYFTTDVNKYRSVLIRQEAGR